MYIKEIVQLYLKAPLTFHIIILSILIAFLIAIVILLFRKHKQKRKPSVEDEIAGYYSNLSADEMLRFLKDMDIPHSETEMLNRFMEMTRLIEEQKKRTFDMKKQLQDYMQLQQTITDNMMKLHEKHESASQVVSGTIVKQLGEVENSIRTDASRNERTFFEQLQQLKINFDQLAKDISLLRSIASNKKEEGSQHFDQVLKDQEILSERMTTLNDHINAQKSFFESKLNTIAEQERTLLTLTKDVNLMKTTLQDFELYVKNQFDHVQRSTHMESGHSMKEFGDLIKEKMDNFFEERKNQFQKIEIELDELKHMDTAKQNILLRLQKEFSGRLTDVNLRLSEQKNNAAENMLHAENTKHQLLELEKAIQELKIQLQGKQHEFYNRQDIRLQSFEDRFSKISEALQQKSEEVSHTNAQKQIELHDTRINHLLQEIEKLKQVISVQQTISPASAGGSDTIEHQIKELRTMVTSLIHSLKE